MVKIPPLKHIVNGYATGQNLSAATAIDIAIGTLNPDSYTTSTNVRNGSVIKVIDVAIDWLMQDSASRHDSFDWYIWFNVNGAQTVPNPQTVNASHLKNQVFHQDGTIASLVVGTNVGYQVPNTRSWRLRVAVPKWAQQLNDGDKITFVMQTSVAAATSDYRVQFIYKEIYP